MVRFPDRYCTVLKQKLGAHVHLQTLFLVSKQLQQNYPCNQPTTNIKVLFMYDGFLLMT